MGATKRILQYIDYKGITKYKFCKDLGFSNKFLDNSINMGTDKACKILHYYPEINPTWLLTGKGSMLLDNNNVVSGSVVSEPAVAYKEPPQASFLHSEIQSLKERIKDKEEIINLYKLSLKDKEETIGLQKERLKEKKEIIISQKEKLKENEEKIKQADTLIQQLKKHLSELQEKWAELNKKMSKEKKDDLPVMDVGNELPLEHPANQSRLTLQQKLQEDKRKGLRK